MSGAASKAPEAEVRAVFDGGHFAVADFEHVGIVPVAGAGVGFEAVFGVDNFHEAEAVLLAVPAVGDVAGGAPHVADVAGPEPRLVAAPFADAEENWAAGGFQRVAHGRVGPLGAGLAGIFAGVAPVEFQIVDAPCGVLDRVLEFVAGATGTAGAGLRAGVGVDAELQAL